MINFFENTQQLFKASPPPQILPAVPHLPQDILIKLFKMFSLKMQVNPLSSVCRLYYKLAHGEMAEIGTLVHQLLSIHFPVKLPDLDVIFRASPRYIRDILNFNYKIRPFKINILNEEKAISEELILKLENLECESFPICWNTSFWKDETLETNYFMDETLLPHYNSHPNIRFIRKIIMKKEDCIAMSIHPCCISSNYVSEVQWLDVKRIYDSLHFKKITQILNTSLLIHISHIAHININYIRENLNLFTTPEEKLYFNSRGFIINHESEKLDFEVTIQKIQESLVWEAFDSNKKIAFDALLEKRHDQVRAGIALSIISQTMTNLMKINNMPLADDLTNSAVETFSILPI